jgi:hypothetical protein
MSESVHMKETDRVMDKISPKFSRALTVAIVRRASKTYPSPGIVGVYSFNGQQYRNKKELREAVLIFCSGLNYEQVPIVQRNFNL